MDGTRRAEARSTRSRLPPRAPDGRFVAVPSRPSSELDRTSPALYLNRELSWLEFNRRVLAMATDASLPLLERLRYIAIFHGNLDEFFMVRVAGLKRQVQAGITRPTPDGLSPAAQLAMIAKRLRPMLSTATTTLHEQLFRLLQRNGIGVVSMADLTPAQAEAAERYFTDEVFPVLTPLAVDPGHPFPYISNLSISLAVELTDPRRGATRFARVKVPRVLPRFVQLDDSTFVPLEELMRANLDRLFAGLTVKGSYTFRVTRNADLELTDEGADDLLMAIEEELRKRRFGAVVRLEVDSSVPDSVTELLQDELDVGDAETYHISGLLGCDDLAQLADLDRPDLRWRPCPTLAHPRLRSTRYGDPADVMQTIRDDGDLIIHHPYNSFGQSVEQLLTQAAEDPDVLAIKMTLYRTSGDSPIVNALIAAAERGKQVVTLVELKARFDEENNIVWARKMERAGVHVVYGLIGLKTHAKIALVVRREHGALQRYVHVGSGNYNPRTATLYTDVGLLSSDAALGADLSELFNVLTGYSHQAQFRKLLVAPWGLRRRVLQLIDREIGAHSTGERTGVIRLQLNSLVDAEMIAALYRASRAGIDVRLMVRGICTLRPQIRGLSERIEVRSILGQFLEHARILQFGVDDVFIGSADLMQRNLDRRVEVLVPVEQPALRAELSRILDVMWADNTMAWRLGAGGSWSRVRPRGDEPAMSAQRTFMASARTAALDSASR